MLNLRKNPFLRICITCFSLRTKNLFMDDSTDFFLLVCHTRFGYYTPPPPHCTFMTRGILEEKKDSWTNLRIVYYSDRVLLSILARRLVYNSVCESVRHTVVLSVLDCHLPSHCGGIMRYIFSSFSYVASIIIFTTDMWSTFWLIVQHFLNNNDSYWRYNLDSHTEFVYLEHCLLTLNCTNSSGFHAFSKISLDTKWWNCRVS